MNFVPDPKGIFDGFKDEAGRSSHGFVGLVWNRNKCTLEELPQYFPTDQSFADVVVSQLLTPVEKRRVNENVWEQMTPEEQLKCQTPWYFSKNDIWADVFFEGKGYQVPYCYEAVTEKVNEDMGEDLLNKNCPEKVKVFPYSYNNILLEKVTREIAAGKHNSLCTNLYFNEGKPTHFMNVTSLEAVKNENGEMYWNSFYIERNATCEDRKASKESPNMGQERGAKTQKEGMKINVYFSIGFKKRNPEVNKRFQKALVSAVDYLNERDRTSCRAVTKLKWLDKKDLKKIAKDLVSGIWVIRYESTFVVKDENDIETILSLAENIVNYHYKEEVLKVVIQKKEREKDHIPETIDFEAIVSRVGIQGEYGRNSMGFEKSEELSEKKRQEKPGGDPFHLDI